MRHKIGFWRQVKLRFTIEIGNSDIMKMKLRRKPLRGYPFFHPWCRIKGMDVNSKLPDQAQVKGNILSDSEGIDDRQRRHSGGINAITSIAGSKKSEIRDAFCTRWREMPSDISQNGVSHCSPSHSALEALSDQNPRLRMNS